MAKNNSKAKLNAFFQKYMKDLESGAIDAQASREIGNAIVKEMKNQISKGISPIDAQRFPGYKGAGKKDKYPATVKRYFPLKRNRPVNLYLSGDFLRGLQVRFKSLNGRKVLEIGFFRQKDALKERGHREGANGQPKRPVIPQEGETFNAKIQKIILDMAKVAVERFLKRKTG